MNKVYIITAGTYSAYHIVAVFASKDEADAFAEEHNRKCGDRYDADCRVEEYPVGADISLAGKNLYYAETGYRGDIYVWDTCEPVLNYANEIGIVKRDGADLECYIAVPMNQDDPEEYARKVAADLFAEYEARKEGIT